MTQELIRSSLLLFAVLAVLPPLIKGQDVSLPMDSLQLEQLVEAYGPGDFRSNARRAVLSLLRDNHVESASELVEFVEYRKGGEGWLVPAEELLVQTLIADIAFLRDTVLFVSLLARYVQEPEGSAIFEDRLLPKLRQILQNNPDVPLRRIQASKAGLSELHFFQLLQNAQLVSGVRTVKDINSQIDRFLEDYPSSKYGLIANTYLRSHLAMASFGAGFFLGYTLGGMAGSESGVPGRVDGFTVRGALYQDHLTFSAELLIARLSLRDSFSVGNNLWKAGSAGLLGMMLDIGYEFPLGGALFTPFIGGTVYRLRQDSAESSSKARSTGLHVGPAFGCNLAYRVKFDTGPHLDFGLHLTAIFPGLSNYSSDLDGALILVGMSFGFVGRPYQVLRGTGN